MVNNKLNIGIKGEITVKTINPSKEEEVIFNSSNNITMDSLEIITRCLSQQDFNKSVDRIKIIGDFGQQESTVNNVHYIPQENAIVFRAVFPESQFSGMITGLELICSALNKKLAIKENLTIFKENSNLLLQVDWKIIITSNQ
mgnify:CR=1 FL=1